VDLNTVIKSRLVVVDALVGMEGGLGPTNGKPVRVGAIVAGDNVVEVDAACARIIGLDPREVAHIRLAAERGLGRLDGFEVLGDGIEAVRRPFELPAHPDLNRFMISGVFLKIYHFLRRPLDRLLGRALSGRVGEVKLDRGRCDGCRICVKACPVEAVTMAGDLPAIDTSLCIACFCCAEACPRGALSRA
jgi:NAD-dependent dihydropyrimidine dehydrogenase PreA subunit